jgi:ABC-type branched-subunit amino acid transport system ATPase component
MALLEVRGLEVAYGDSRALWGVDIYVDRGEIVALIGANGAGKTTLLNTIAGLLRPSSGNIYFDGDLISGLSADEVVVRGIALVPEGRRLFSGMTVRENLLMGAYRRSDRKKVVEDLDRVYGLFPALSDRRQQIAGRLSGGEQQMCAIGRGLMSRPQILLIDEMSLGLAPVVVDRLIDKLETVHLEEKTDIVLVEQDAQLALDIASRGYVMENGRIVMEGATATLRDAPSVRDAYLGLSSREQSAGSAVREAVDRSRQRGDMADPQEAKDSRRSRFSTEENQQAEREGK